MVVDEDTEEEDQSDGWVGGREVGIELGQRGDCGGIGDVSSVHK